MLPNKRLNMHLDETWDEYIAYTLLPLIFGHINMDKEDILQLASLISTAFFEGDGHSNHDPYTSCGVKDINGYIISKDGKLNYKIEGHKAELPEIENYLEKNQNVYHVGRSPTVNLDCSCASGIRSSSLGAAMMHVNGIVGFKEGGFWKWKNKNSKLDFVGYDPRGNSFYFSLDSTGGIGGKLELAKYDFLERMIADSIFKTPQLVNLREFRSGKWKPDVTVSGGRCQDKKLTPAEMVEVEPVRREMMLADKRLKEAHKQVCRDGLGNLEALAVYNRRIEAMLKRQPFKFLPQGSLCSRPITAWISGLGQADGCIRTNYVSIGQSNPCFNKALVENFGKVYYNAKYGATDIRIIPKKDQMLYHLSVGLHYSHRREQNLVAVIIHLFSHDIGLGTKLDLAYLSPKIADAWNSNLSEHSKHRENVNSWVEQQKRTRNYQNGLVDENEIKSLLTVLGKALEILLTALKKKDLS